MPTRRRAVAASCALLTSGLLVVLAGPTPSATAHSGGGGGGRLAASIAVDWQRTAARTIYVERETAPPLGAVYLAFTSLAVNDAAREGQRHGTDGAAAAVAVAAHDVLRAYFPASGAALEADLNASLAKIPDGRKETAGRAIGAAAAAEMIASRAADGRNDASILYSKPATLGFWQPPTGGAMALPWLGFVKPVIAGVVPVTLDGPDPITSRAYAREYEEVRLIGGADSSTRTAQQTAVAQFFSANPVLMYRNALCDLLAAKPLALRATTRLFARIDAAVATTMIETWRLKYAVGYWRPFQAIAAGAVDGNAGTNPHPTAWAPLVTNPPYSDYTSGHAGATAPFAEVVRRTLGDKTPLLLRSGTVERRYTRLSALERDALDARIWGGLHFRDAMDDGYRLGHSTARRVMRAIH